MKKIIIGGIVAGVVIIIVGMVFGALASGMYKMSPKALWKPMGGNWVTEYCIFDIIVGLLLAWVYSLVSPALDR